jgi:large subunit ribosomal protein L21
VPLEPILYRSEEAVFDKAGLERVKVTAKVLGHERGEKLRVFKFKPKRGYKRRNGHRQELTRIEVTDISQAARRQAAKADDKPAANAAGDKPAAKAGGEKPAAKASGDKPAAKAGGAKPAAKAGGAKPAAKGTAKAPARKPAAKARGTKEKPSDGS